MGANFSRVKTWVSTEDVAYDDLNAEFDNILDNLTASNVDDFSANVTQMQSTTDPGEVGTESLATSVSGELQRLRHLIGEITGEDEWYESPVSSLLGLANSIGTGLTANRIVSGKVRSSGVNEQPIFLNANGAARTVTVKGASTNFIYYVDGVEYTISTDVDLTGLTAAPSSNNTCLINDANATGGQAWTKWTGEVGAEIPVDTMGSEIQSLVGKFAAFKLAGAATEYFIAYVKSTTSLTKAFRGYFFDSSDAPVKRTTYTNNDTITLMKLTWVFAKSDGTLTATYNNPVWSKDEPSSPSLGDYWFDLANNTWKVYGVGSYSAANATLIGACIQDATNTVAARSFEFFANYNELNTMELFYESASQVKSRYPGANVNVWGNTIKSDRNIRTWDMTLDLDSGITEAASTTYYFYLTQKGDVVISDVRPFDRREDLQGYYHPHSSWRCIGSAYNDGSSNLGSVESYYRRHTAKEIYPSTTAAQNLEVVPRIYPLDSSGGAFTHYLPPAAHWRGQVLTFIKTSSDVSAITIDGYSSETINGSTTTTLNTQYEKIDLLSDGTNIYIMNRYIPSVWTSYTPTFTGLGTPTNVTAFWRRDRDSIQVRGSCISGTVTAVNLTITLPLSLTLDTAKLNSVTHTEDLGGLWFNINTSIDAVPSSGRGRAAITYSSSDGTGVVQATRGVDLDSVATGSFFTSQATTIFQGNSSGLIFDFVAPISGWKG